MKDLSVMEDPRVHVKIRTRTFLVAGLLANDIATPHPSFAMPHLRLTSHWQFLSLCGQIPKHHFGEQHGNLARKTCNSPFGLRKAICFLPDFIHIFAAVYQNLKQKKFKNSLKFLICFSIDFYFDFSYLLESGETERREEERDTVKDPPSPDRYTLKKGGPGKNSSICNRKDFLLYEEI